MLKIYGAPISVHARRALVAARMKGIDFENVPVVPFDPPEGWRELSPTGRIPVLDHDGFRIGDSSVICAYLDRIGTGPSLYPADPKGFAKAAWLERYASDCLCDEVVGPLLTELLIKPKLLQAGEPDPAVVQAAREAALPRVFAYLNGQVEAPFFAGDDVSIADLAVASYLVSYRYLGFEIDAARYPKLARAFERTVAAPAFQAALEAEQPLRTQLGLDGASLAA